MEEKKLQDQIISALIHVLYNFFIYFLIIVPFDLWKKATIRLANQKEEGTISISKITGLWPFLSFLKAYIFEFLIDGIIFTSYVWGLMIGIVAWIKSGEILSFFAGIVSVYLLPILMSLIRDFLQLLVLPFKKFLSWASKPAQYMDLEIKNK
jgi:hypothetical protein